MFKNAPILVLVTSLGLVAGLMACREESAANAAGKKIMLVIESSQIVKQGETDSVPVTVSRTKFEGAVDVQFSNLPSGVSVTDGGSIATGDNTRTYTLVASPTATAVKDHVVSVTARSGDVSVTETFKLTVNPKT